LFRVARFIADGQQDLSVRVSPPEFCHCTHQDHGILDIELGDIFSLFTLECVEVAEYFVRSSWALTSTFADASFAARHSAEFESARAEAHPNAAYDRPVKSALRQRSIMGAVPPAIHPRATRERDVPGTQCAVWDQHGTGADHI
jgi:hypothetical protein